MKALSTIHRWWGIAFCLLFAMWFASGIVMHFVPYPTRSEAPYPTSIDTLRATTEVIDYDQWTVAGKYDRDRPLKHITVNDDAGTEIYLAVASGTVVLTTTRTQRIANYAGSIPHWLYATELRHHKRAWTALVWWLSLITTIGAALGVMLGLLRLRKAVPYSGLYRWHHLAGLVFAPFLLTWIFSGFLSMDDGTLFSDSDALFRALHKLDFEPLSSRPQIRASVIVALCLCGFACSVTGVVLAWRRLRAA